MARSTCAFQNYACIPGTWIQSLHMYKHNHNILLTKNNLLRNYRYGTSTTDYESYDDNGASNTRIFNRTSFLIEQFC